MEYPPLKSTNPQDAIAEVWGLYGDGTPLVSTDCQAAVAEIWKRIGNVRQMNSTNLEGAINEVYTSFDFNIGVIAEFDMGTIERVTSIVPSGGIVSQIELSGIVDGIASEVPLVIKTNEITFEERDYTVPSYGGAPTDQANIIPFEDRVYTEPTYGGAPTDNANLIEFEDW
ncbi:hypothetical protein MYOV002v2_p0200 [Vibrio phage 144E46.1]|nr:hypothetical protein MYOV002v2_p0200 [Vibrio phage 144E46.1]